MDLFTALQTRRSIRHYTDQPVPVESIERVLTLAMWAPSAHDRQPWRWAVLTTEAAKTRLAQAMGERRLADGLAAGDPLDEVEGAIARSYRRITGAPVVMAACLTMAGAEAGAQRRRAEYLMGVQSVAAAIQNLLLAAQAEGLGACWMCAPLACPDAVRSALDLPADWEAQALITLGYPAESKTPAPRRASAEVIVHR